MQMLMSALGSWAVCPNAAATNYQQSWAAFTHCRQKWTKSAHLWPIPGSPHSGRHMMCCSATSHLTFPLTFPPLKNVKPHNLAPEEAGGTRQDLMTLQRKLATTGIEPVCGKKVKCCYYHLVMVLLHNMQNSPCCAKSKRILHNKNWLDWHCWSLCYSDKLLCDCSLVVLWWINLKQSKVYALA